MPENLREGGQGAEIRAKPVLVPDFDIRGLVPLDGNPRVIDSAGRARLRASLERFGLVDVIVANERGDGARVVVSGNQRWRDLMDRGVYQAPVMLVRLGDQDERVLALTLNGHAGSWDDDLLERWCRELAGAGEDLDLLGLEGIDGYEAAVAELDAQVEDDTHADEAPPVQPDAVSRPGEIYALGPHRLVCGSSADPAVVGTLLEAQVIAAVWTDPPYGVAYVGKTADALTVENDDLDAAGLRNLLAGSLGIALERCVPGAPWYVAAPGGPLFLVFGQLLQEWGIWRETLIWAKGTFVLGRSDYHWRHEPIFYGWKPGAAHPWFGGRAQDTVLEFDKPAANRDHPTMKPVDLVIRCLQNSTDRDSLVYDPFGGSGTTLLAAARTGRRAALCELSPQYCDVIRRRWTRYARDHHLDPGPGALDP